MYNGHGKEMGKTRFLKFSEGIYDVVYSHIRRTNREMQRFGQKTSGPLARQSDESMVSYTRRRKLWWTPLKEMDPKLEMRPDILA